MRITEAAQRLGMSPRMLRYRDLLGLLPPVRVPGARRPARAWERAPAPTGERAAAPPGTARRAAGGRERTGRPAAPAHRRFSEEDLAAVSLAIRIEQRYGITPAALAFGVRVLTEPGVRADVAELGRRIGQMGPPPARALDFEKQRAMRLLGQPGSTGSRHGRGAAVATPRRRAPGKRAPG
jgi:MerR family transcriptional regulator, copper efflux regulator